MKKITLNNGMVKYQFENKIFIFNVDFKMPKQKKSMFQILSSICFGASPAAYCSDLSYEPAGLEDFFAHLDKFLSQDKFEKVNFHYGRAI